MKKIFILFLVSISTGLFAQQDFTVYNMDFIPQRQYLNPGLMPASRINIGLPVISSVYANFSNSGFRYSELIRKGSDDSLHLDVPFMLGKLKDNNYISTAINTDIISFGFKVKERNYFAFNATEKVTMRFRYPKDFISLLWYGNGEMLGQELNFNFGMDATHYREYGLLYNRSFLEEKLNVGAKLKYLYGMENVWTEKSDVSLTTDPAYFALTAKSDVIVNTSGVDSADFDDVSNYLFGKGNKGWGIDIGGTYKVSEKVSVSASMIDLGFIKWKDNVSNFKSKNPGASYTYEGVDISEILKSGNDSIEPQLSFEDFGDKLIDTIGKTFEIGKFHEEYKTKLSTQIYMGGNYHLNEKNHAGLLLYGQFFDGTLNKGMSLSYNTHIARWLSASATYSIYNRSYNNFGLGLTLNAGPVQLYVVSDNVLGAFFPQNAKNLHVHWGINLTFGRKPKDKDKDGLNDKVDVCPDVAGLKEFNGCPDKDGDKVADKDDSCPDIAGIVSLRGCPDRDGDQVADNDDACPDTAGVIEFKGCPDSDGDRIIDMNDDCPTVAGIEKFKGCPDTDNDGIKDSEDKCPEAAGTVEFNGCPDKDGDGIDDASDLCPDVAGTKENFGCPFGDKDKDGVFDKDDACPNTPGPADNKGCPVIQKEEQEVLNTAFSNLEFASGKDVIKNESFSSLDELAKLLVKKPEWNLRLSGHTDNVGNAKANLTLSQKRTEAVKKYLVSKGVDASRITAEGFGAAQPIADNKTEAGRQKNRRVEMKIEFK